MTRLSPLLLVSLVALAPPLSGQTAPRRTPEQIQASLAEHQNDFDYLLGDWEFSSVHHEYGTARGYWSAVRLAEGAPVYDEYRIVDDSNHTLYVTTTLRVYNATLDQWELVSMEPGSGLQNRGTGKLVGKEMHIEQRFGVMSSEPSLWRIRYYDIRPDRFSWTADRSTDEGRSWVHEYLKIEARRIGAARRMEPLAPPKGGTAQGSP